VRVGNLSRVKQNFALRKKATHASLPKKKMKKKEASESKNKAFALSEYYDNIF
jgi:hypothetical protein